MTPGEVAKAMAKDLLGVQRLSNATISGQVIDATPVLLGSLKASWNASIGDPVVNNVNIGESSFAPRNNFTSVINGMQLGDTYSMCNGQPYANRIENEGWSSYALNGMMGPAVENWDATVRAAQNGN